MAELSFTKEGSKYVCEFEVSSDFNLHLERDKGGFLFLYQRSSDGGSYDSVGDAKFAPHDYIIDYDCTALVYPKTIKIVSEVEPTYAAVTTDGEVTEIKAQSKEIEVTSNGTTNVTPDAGFAYLNSVKVKTNVPTSGEGGGSASTMEYFSAQDAQQLKPYLSVVKLSIGSGAAIQISPFIPKITGMVENSEILAFGVDFQARNMVLAGDQKVEMTSLDAIIQETGLPADQIAAIPRITEAEFYNLNA